MARTASGIFSRELTLGAIKDSFPKLDPRLQFKNPVMFIVELGSVITTVIFFLELARGNYGDLWFVGTIAIWLWLTVLFANFAEAIAEGRGKAQAETLRATRTTTLAHLQDGRELPAAELQRGDVVIVEAGEMSGSIPEDDVVTASTGMSPIVRPGLYGRSSFRIAWAFCETSLARSGLVGPRFKNVVAPAL